MTAPRSRNATSTASKPSAANTSSRCARSTGACTSTAGYRTASYNARIGGASASYHVYTIHDGNDQAADITCAQGTPRDWHRTLAWLRSNKRGGRGGLGLYSTFVHVDIRDYPANWTG